MILHPQTIHSPQVKPSPLMVLVVETLSGDPDANETIKGGDGDDELFGGAGANVLAGGLGADEFQFTMTSTNDSVTDFTAAEGDATPDSSILVVLRSIEIAFQLNSAGDELSIASGSD